MVNQRDSTKVKKPNITFMVLPHNSSRNIFRLSLPYWLATALAAFLISLLLVIAGFFIYSTLITTRLIQYYAIKAENKRQSNQLKVFITKIKELETGVRELEERDQELREMLGLQKKHKEKFSGQSSINTPEELDQVIANLNARVKTKKAEYNGFKDVAVAVRFRYDLLPSIWPVIGNIQSPYGWRIHPFTGGMELHKGIDIPGWVGQPIRAAADGTVVYADWARGYGNALIVDHHNGYSTLYGHCSHLLVKRWEKVYKGQVIASVGDTGLATGPHLHYEVKQKKTPVNPVNFLDLNIRSAQNF